jgi:spore germination protein GerM
VSPRQANLATVIGLAALLALVALTAPRWAGLLSEPLTVFDPESPGEAGDGTSTLDPEGTAARRINVRLYFASPDSVGLLSEERTIAFSDDLAVQLRTLVEELVAGPQTALEPTLPPETRVLEVFVTTRGVAFVNLSGDVASEPGGSKAELLTVYSLVNSLVANFPAISRVQLLVEDRMVTSLGGHVDLSRPLPADMTLIALPPAPSPETPTADGAPGTPYPAPDGATR